MPGNGIGPVHAPTAARGNPASNPTPGSSEPRCAASGSPDAMDVRTPSGSPPRTTASKPRYADGTDTPTANGANTRRKRNEKNNTHHTRHHRHMHGARRMRKRVGAFRASVCGQVRRLAVLRRGRRIHGMRHHPDDTRKVDCIVYSTNSKQAGLSCDWSHVSGADKEPAR